MFKRIHLITMAYFIGCGAQLANAGLIEFWDNTPAWLGATGKHTFIDFNGFSAGTPVTSQFPGMTVTSFSFIQYAEGYNDWWGLSSPNGVKIEFDTPIHALAVDHLGVVQFTLLYKGEVVTTSSEFNYAVPGGPFFSGFISDAPFDEIYMFKPQPPFSNNNIALDNLYWGMPIPAPGTLPLLGVALFPTRRRRRFP